MLTVNPAEAVSPPRVPRGEMHALNAAEAARFLQAASGNQEFGPLFTTAIYSGLRLGELRGLRWRDVDFEGGALSIQQTLSQVEAGLVFAPTKTHRSRRRVSIRVAGGSPAPSPGRADWPAPKGRSRVAGDRPGVRGRARQPCQRETPTRRL